TEPTEIVENSTLPCNPQSDISHSPTAPSDETLTSFRLPNQVTKTNDKEQEAQAEALLKTLDD
ncbi:hypothetical protein M2H03_22815, partial [Vibrio vulnificus]|nr:hypothetical protein [Vibrio vulnificus]